MNNINTEIDKDIENAVEIIDPKFKKKKLIFWAIRNIISAILYYIFWENYWVRMSLYATIPISIFSLLMIFLTPLFIKRQFKKPNK